jgi:hypothetical protein
MKETLEFATAVLDTVSFVLVTPDLFGKERLTRVGENLQKVADGLVSVMAPWLKALPPMLSKDGLNTIGKIGTVGLVIIFLLPVIIWPADDPVPDYIYYHIKIQSGFMSEWLNIVILPILAVVIGTVVIGSVVLLCFRLPAVLMLALLHRYNFNGMLLGLGAASFLASRALIIYNTWPH